MIPFPSRQLTWSDQDVPCLERCKRTLPAPTRSVALTQAHDPEHEEDPGRDETHSMMRVFVLDREISFCPSDRYRTTSVPTFAMIKEPRATLRDSLRRAAT